MAADRTARVRFFVELSCFVAGEHGPQQPSAGAVSPVGAASLFRKGEGATAAYALGDSSGAPA